MGTSHPRPDRAGARPASPAPRAGGVSGTDRPIGSWAFAGVAVSSLGGPLALAALIVPAGVELTAQFASAGLARVIGVGVAVSVARVILPALALAAVACALAGYGLYASIASPAS